MLLNLKNLSLHFGNTALLDGVNLTIEPGERLCLLGRNGTGKSTLLRVIAGEMRADDGEIFRSQSMRIAQLPQDVPHDLAGTVYDVVADGLGDVGRLVAEYHHVLEHRGGNLAELSRVQSALEAQGGWALQSRVEATLSRLSLNGEAEFSALSGGLKRRALLARSLVCDPDLLLLDEPTNHLDIASISWLEEFLLDWNGTLLFVTHDRAFLRRLATRIVELDRGRLTSWPGTYDDYLRRKAEALQAEAQQNALFDKKLAQEEAWIRQGIEARRTRNEGRVRALYALREQYRERRTLPGRAKLVGHEAERSGKLVVEAQDVSFSYGDRLIVSRFSTLIVRGDKIGVIGPNGAGKTTLLNLLLGRLTPDSGSVKLGARLEIAYFDQLRASLDEDKPVYDNIGGGKDYVEINGARRHVMSYLQDFLFAADRGRSPVRSLSGGERSRLLLARLFAQPSNVLVLDEPTNDLDVETLDLLEELLLDYSGTVLLVSHDREFLNNVVTRSLVFEGAGRVGDYVGGYDDWLRQRPEPEPRRPVQPKVGAPRKPVAKPSRLSFKEKRELESLPARIHDLETEQSRLAAMLSDGTIYQRDRNAALNAQQRLAEIEQEITSSYSRWEQLENPRA